MHKGKEYPVSFDLLPLNTDAPWPQWLPQAYIFRATSWADGIGVHPVAGDYRLLLDAYPPGQLFCTYSGSVPCDPGHFVRIQLLIRLNADQTLMKQGASVFVDGVLQGFQTLPLPDCTMILDQFLFDITLNTFPSTFPFWGPFHNGFIFAEPWPP